MVWFLLVSLVFTLVVCVFFNGYGLSLCLFESVVSIDLVMGGTWCMDVICLFRRCIL